MNRSENQESAVPASVRNAPDLSELLEKKSSVETSSVPGEGTGEATWRYEVTERQQFQDLVQLSSRGAVVFGFYAEESPASVQIMADLEKLVNSAQGNLLLASVNISKQPEIAQAFQVQGVPAAIAVIAGQTAPLFTSQVSAEQMSDLLSQLLQAAAQYQLPGGFPSAPVEGAEKKLPPLHQKALDAAEQGDYEGARAAYQQAINENPGDKDAKAGLARIGLMERIHGIDVAEVRERAANDATDVEAAFAVADADITGGHVEDAFARLIRLFKAAKPEQKNAVRERLLELFDVVGTQDPRVTKARAELMMALF